MNKVDFICYIIVRNCNPNGDFEENNRPKQDLDTGLGIMTDVCIKRKIRDTVNVLRDGIPGYDMYIKDDHIALESKVSFMFPAEEEKNILSKTPAQRDSYIKGLLCASYFDVRAFGAAVTYLANKRYCDGQMTGAVQIGFAESLEPITPVKNVITRVDVSTEADLKKKDREVGAKWTVPYAVYKFEGHVSAGMAKKNGFTEDDLSVLIEAIQKMYDFGYSSSKTGMEVSKLIVFRHGSELGDCRFKQLRDSVKEEFIENIPGRREVVITVDKSMIPDTVKVEEY